MGRRPHVLVVPFPAQGHVAPLMKLAHKVSDHGIKVTFVNTEFIHAKIMASMPDKDGKQSRIELVSVPDGLNPGANRNDAVMLTESILTVMPGHVKDLIEKINRTNDDEKITCVIADTTVGWALEVAEKMGIKRAAVWPGGPGDLALALHIPKLIEARIIDTDGKFIFSFKFLGYDIINLLCCVGAPMKNELIHLAEDIPAFSITGLSWNLSDDLKIRDVIFGYAFRVSQTVKLSNWLLCNSFYELHSSACNLISDILPIGPLLASNHPAHSAGNFWAEDSTCLRWLDKQPAGSVIYVAFGSLAILSQHQFNELALGIELVGRPFLWVARSDFTNGSAVEYPDGFMQRVSEYGKIVEWADQEKVLAHPSVACFLSHCGWNSTMEGVSMGVPFLCWPQFADQFCNRNFICDIWKVGLGLDPDGNGIISRHEIKIKIEKLLSDDGIKANALKLKEMARESVSEDGSSSKNFKAFIEAVKH